MYYSLRSCCALPIAAILTAVLGPAPSQLKADVFGIIAERNGNLSKLDITTGTTNIIKSNDTIFTGLAYNADETTLYGIVEPTLFSISSLVMINQTTGATTTIGSNGTTLVTFSNLSDGRLFGVDRNDNLYQIDPNTGSSTLMGATGLPPLSSFFSWQNSLSSDGTHLYYTLASNNGDSLLYSLNDTTGTATLIGSTGMKAIVGSAFAGPTFHTGQLYGFRNNGQTVTINTTTGVATAFNSNGHSDIFGGVGIITDPRASSVPEPATLSMIALAGLGLLIRSRK